MVGQAVVEFALALPLLLALLMGITDVGRMVNMKIALANAAREGARYCALHPGDAAGTRARVAGEAAARVGAVAAVDVCPATPRGQPVTVTASATFTPITPYVQQIAGASIQISAPATMVVW